VKPYVLYSALPSLFFECGHGDRAHGNRAHGDRARVYFLVG
jgi:hypothetical protein